MKVMQKSCSAVFIAYLLFIKIVIIHNCFRLLLVRFGIRITLHYLLVFFEKCIKF